MRGVKGKCQKIALEFYHIELRRPSVDFSVVRMNLEEGMDTYLTIRKGGLATIYFIFKICVPWSGHRPVICFCISSLALSQLWLAHVSHCTLLCLVLGLELLSPL